MQQAPSKTPFWAVWLSIVAWIGLATGIAEGIVRVIARWYPLIRAAHKVSNDILWVAAIVDVLAFILIGLVLLPVAVWLRRRSWMLWGGAVLAGFGAFLVITAPGVVSRYGSLTLALGCGVMFYRMFVGRNERLESLRSRAWMIPVIVLILWAGVNANRYVREEWAMRQIPPAAAGARNSLVIVLDTVRADRFFNLLGAGKLPHMKQLASRGMVYTNAWSTSSWSPPGHGSILTGRLPEEHKVDWPTMRQDHRYPSLAEFYLSKGYWTGAFSGNAAWITPEYVGAGFARFRAYILENLVRRTRLGLKFDETLSERLGIHTSGRGKKAPQIREELTSFLERQPERPFFTYLCFMDVNQAFHNRRINLKGTLPEILADYDAALVSVDEVIGGILQDLRERGKLENTDIVIASDHGESFDTQNPGDHHPDGHGTSLYREQQAVPMIVVGAGVAPGVNHEAVSIQQIPQTLMSMQKWSHSPFVGAPLPLSAMSAAEPCVFADLQEHVSKAAHSVTYNSWRFLEHFKNGLELKLGPELYNTTSDHLESKNLAGDPSAAEVLATMRAQARDFEKTGTGVPCRILPSMQGR